jgi:ABC-type amino acid transport substrate-binding protein
MNNKVLIFHYRRLLPLLGAVLALAQPVAAQELRTASIERPPKFIKADGPAIGLCPDILAALQQADPQLQFSGLEHFYPAKRIESMLQEGSLDVFCGLAKTPERSRRLILLEPALYQLDFQLAVRANDTVEVRDFADIRNLGAQGRVLLVTGPEATKLIENQPGLLVDDGAETPAQAFGKLLAKRGRFVYFHGPGLRHAIEQDHLAQRVRILPAVLVHDEQYLAVSPKLALETLERLRTTLQKLASNGQLQLLFRRYQ